MPNYKILIVEDELLIANNLSRKLKKLGYIIADIVASGEAAMESASATIPDLILMDISLKGKMDGIETAAKINASTHKIPVIYLTAYADDQTLQRAEKTRSYGYLLKPFKERELHATITMALSKHQEFAAMERTLAATKAVPEHNRCEGRPYPLQSLLELKIGKTQDLLGNNIAKAGLIPLLFLNLDRFNQLNQSLGDEYRDLLLSAVAKRIKHCIDPEEKIAHLKGNEFAIVLKPIERKQEVDKVVKTILDKLREPFSIDEHQIFLTASIGITFFHWDGTELYKLLQQARKAMKQAKLQGGNRYQFYTGASS